MSKGPLRFLVVAALLVVVCKGPERPVNPVVPPVPANECASRGVGVQNNDTPLVCVSDSPLAANPSSIRVWHVNSVDRVTRPTIQWITRGGGGNLQITMKNGETDCVETPVCNGKGHCSATVKSGFTGAAGAELKRCHYTITLDGKVLDPDAVIVGCC